MATPFVSKLPYDMQKATMLCAWPRPYPRGPKSRGESRSGLRVEGLGFRFTVEGLGSLGSWETRVRVTIGSMQWGTMWERACNMDGN